MIATEDGKIQVQTAMVVVLKMSRPYPMTSVFFNLFIPIGSMYGIFTYIYHQNQLNVGKHTVHGSYGIFYQGNLFLSFTISTGF